jgi:SAM-dependent methyltransferase
MPDESRYVLGTNPAEQQRLREQSLVWAQESSWLLDQIGVQPGWRAIDVGCGPRGILDLLSARVGPTGSVVGLEQNPEHARLAVEFCRQSRLENVTIITADVTSAEAASESFDLVHERAVLVNVPDPRAILKAMIRLAKPGAVVACDDIDQSTRITEPSNPAWDLLNGLILEQWRRSGADPFFARRLWGLMRQAEFEDVRVRLRAPEFWDIDHPRRFQILTFVDNLQEAMVAGGLITHQELVRQKSALQRHLEDPDAIAISGLGYQVWARKPT